MCYVTISKILILASTILHWLALLLTLYVYLNITDRFIKMR